jgi:Fic family protein
MNLYSTGDGLLTAIRDLAIAGHPRVSSSQIASRTGASLATIKRQLDQLVRANRLIRTGRARATRYSLPVSSISYVAEPAAPAIVNPVNPAKPATAPPWSNPSLSLRAALMQPLGARTPVTYQRQFVDGYIPNESFLLDPDIAQTLFAAGRMQGQQPAGTYARKVLEQLLIDLSWSSSRLEGNRYSLLATEELFKSGSSLGDTDTVMLLNHKRAIEFMVDAVPEYGLTQPIVRNLHAVLMQDLLETTDALGAVRNMVVNIHGSVYLPAQVPSLLEEMLATVIDKARLVKNPVEAAFFLWVNLAYLQPFEDGNKRTSRLAANIPLMLYNCAPLSFLDVDQQDYALAMMGLYENLDVSLARDLFEWTCRRSLTKYAVVLAAAGAPDPLRLRYREALNEALGLVVREGKTMLQAFGTLNIPSPDAAGFQVMLQDEINKLNGHNCARFRLAMHTVEHWVAAGRPH